MILASNNLTLDESRCHSQVAAIYFSRPRTKAYVSWIDTLWIPFSGPFTSRGSRADDSISCLFTKRHSTTIEPVRSAEYTISGPYMHYDPDPGLWDEYPPSQAQIDPVHGSSVPTQRYEQFQDDQDDQIALGPEVFWGSMIDPHNGSASENAEHWAFTDESGMPASPKFPRRSLRRSGARVSGMPSNGIRDLHSADVLSTQNINTSQVSLPVSSGSSDITDGSISLPDAGQYASGSFPDQGFSGTPTAFAAPTPLPISSMQSLVYHTGSSWQSEGLNPVAGPARFNLVGASATDDQSSPTEMPYDLDSHPGIWPSGSADLIDQFGTRSEMDPSLISQPMPGYSNATRTAPIPCSRTTSHSIGQSLTSPSFSVPSPLSRRSSTAQNDNISIDLNTLNIAHDLADPVQTTLQETSRIPTSPDLSVRSAESNRKSRDSSRPHHASPHGVNLGPLPSLELDINENKVLGSPSGQDHRPRASDETEMGVARNHPLYQASPKDDGLFHCPYEGADGCNHKPAPLKCNYDKFVDSHLRPYRCKTKTCGGLQFSSTACLLRHEREAHGMHGHGAKPFICRYEDCERSVEGCGFPRRWNLLDHMRRVHDFTGDTPSQTGFLPAASVQHDHRKRKLFRAQQKQQSKKSKSNSARSSANGSNPSARKQLSAHRAQQLRSLAAERDSFHSAWQQYSQVLQATQTSLQNDRLESQREGLSRVIADIQHLQGDLTRGQQNELKVEGGHHDDLSRQ
ncbi:MAG: hypothetical protein M1837_001505 [Sclerophora amabilis]|nr:MAG: hypothetical protein M1837_001505 [Sclerophora amabilis]